MKIFEWRFDLFHYDVVANDQYLVLATDHDPSGSVIDANVLYLILAPYRILSCVVSYRKNLNCVIFTADNDLIVQLIPYNLVRLRLHSKRTDFHQSQIVDDFDASVASFAKTTGHQLSSMAVNNVLALFDREFSR